MSEKSQKSFISDLWERRFPQFMATYVGVSWGILQFLIFITNRYGVPSSIIDKFLLFAGLMIPAVTVFIYNHGRRGHDEWTRLEKILIPVNFILAIGIASFAGKGNSVQAAASEVQITTELGDTVTRFVPSVSQTKSIALFPFENKSLEKNNWLRLAYPKLISTDMQQDMRIYCIDPTGFEYAYQSQNYNLHDDIPFSSKLKIAKNKLAQYFIHGTIDFQDNKYIVNITVSESRNGKDFFVQEFESEDFYSIVDNFTTELSASLFLKKSNTEFIEITDLPAAELISSDLEALQSYFQATIAGVFDKNIEASYEYAIAAEKMDDNSAEIKALLSSLIYMNGDIQTAQEKITLALEQSQRLSERQKFNLKSMYYIYKQELGKAFQLWETWRTLYPRDYYPYTQLMRFYSLTRNFKKAKQVGLDAISNGHKERVLKRMAEISIQRDELEEAEAYLIEYLELFPEKEKDDTQLAEIYEKKGEFKKAEKALEKIELLNPEDHNINLKLSENYKKQGQHDKALMTLEKALEKANLEVDSVSIYLQIMIFYYRTGESSKFKEISDKRIELYHKISTDMQVAATVGLQTKVDNKLKDFFFSS